MRLFIAVKVSEEVHEELVRIQKEIGQNGLKLPKDFHITLKFLGDIADDQVEQLKEKLVQAEFESFKLTLDGLDVFHPKRIRVVHIGIKPPEQITELNEKIHSMTKEISIDHPFRAHITIARVKFLEDQKEFLEKVGKIDVKSIWFDINTFYLFKSTLTEKGPIYEELAEFSAKPL